MGIIFHCTILLNYNYTFCSRAMLGNPPVPPYGRDLHDDATEVENYEVKNVIVSLFEMAAY